MEFRLHNLESVLTFQIGTSSSQPHPGMLIRKSDHFNSVVVAVAVVVVVTVTVKSDKTSVKVE